MIGIAMYTTILTLYKQGKSQRQISKITNVHRQTIKKIITKYLKNKSESPEEYHRSSKVEGWHEQIVNLLSKELSVVRIFEEIKAQGFDNSYSALSRYIRRHNIKNTSCIIFHTLPGEEAQVDFGDIGKQYDSNGQLRKAWVFNMRLSYSRLDYYEIVFDQKVNTWINCHINAFNFFGGVPQVIKLDNLKAGIIDANFYEPVYQKEYNRFAKHYGCLLSPCRPYKPQEKGKVESGIKYVKNNFFAGRSFTKNKMMNEQLYSWLDGANARIHGTTKAKPIELFQQEEAAQLIALPLEAFSLEAWHLRKVAKDCHVTIDNNYYSVPSKHVWCDVMISLGSEVVKIYIDEELVATHARAKGKGIFTTNISHYAKNKRSCPGFTEHDEKYASELKRMGDNCAQMLAYLQQEHKKDWHRTAKGVIKLRQFYNDELIDKACLRAMHYGTVGYSKIKKILESNSYILPLGENDKEALYANVN
jgi:transposase